MDKYRNTEPCKNCKVMCCKAMGCHLSPDDLKNPITYESLKALLETKIYSIDWWNDFPLNGKDVNGYYLRVRHKNSPIVDPSFGGVCVLLTEDGCALSFEDRPKGARYLVASNEYNCQSEYTKFQAAENWSKYHDILSKLKEEFEDNTFTQKEIDATGLTLEELKVFAYDLGQNLREVINVFNSEQGKRMLELIKKNKKG